MNKTKAVEEYLGKNKSITSWDAIMKFRATRLSAIIFNLRQRGWNISSADRTTIDGTRYVEYILISKPEEE